MILCSGSAIPGVTISKSYARNSHDDRDEHRWPKPLE